MNCRDLHLHFEQNPVAGVPSDVDAVVAHVSACADCRDFVEEQRRLQEHLRLVRESVPPASESLDTTVLASYRSHMAERNQVEPVTIRKPRAMPVWTWALAAAVILSVAGLYFSRHALHQPVADQKKALPATTLSPVSTTAKARTPAEAPNTVTAVTNSKRLVHHAGSSKGPEAEHASLPRTSPVQSRSSIAENFQSLMYCDPLSCAGGMELIHVQLPSAFVARAVTRSSDFVNADVLVGPDGIARAIRIEQ